MNFNDFCSDNNNLHANSNNDKFEKINENLHKNNKKIGIFAQNKQNFANFSNIDSRGSGEKTSETISEDEIKRRIEKYKNMNQSELMNELLKESNKQKKNGNLDDKKLQDIKNTMSAFMTDEEQKRLDNLIKMLR